MADTASDLLKNEALKQHYAEQMKKNKTKTLLRQDISDKIEMVVPPALIEHQLKVSNVTKELLLLKYPKHKEEFWGHITIYPLYYKIVIYNGNVTRDWKTYWNAIGKCVEETVVAQELKRVKFDLDGNRILFSYFNRACGMLNRQLLFWGL